MSSAGSPRFYQLEKMWAARRDPQHPRLMRLHLCAVGRRGGTGARFGGRLSATAGADRAWPLGLGP